MATIVFDLDGTLVESAAAIRDVANALMAELELAPLSLDETRSFVGRGTPVFLERALRSRDAYDASNFADQLARLHEHYATAPGEANVPFPGVTDALASLRREGYRLCICTNKPAAATEPVLRAHGWDHLFAAVVAGDTLSWRKPDPRPLIAAIGPDADGRAIFVGDSEVDAATARAAGVPFVLFTEGYAHVAHAELERVASFSDFADLPAAIASVLANG